MLNIQFRSVKYIYIFAQVYIQNSSSSKSKQYYSLNNSFLLPPPNTWQPPFYFLK